VLDRLLSLHMLMHDCKTLGHDNCVLKYADDFSLLVPENNDVSAESEMAHIISWSESNKLKINLSKCKGLVFKRPNLKHDISPCTLPNVVRVKLTVLNCLVYILMILCAFVNMSNKLQETVTSDFTCCSNCANKDLVTDV